MRTVLVSLCPKPIIKLEKVPESKTETVKGMVYFPCEEKLRSLGAFWYRTKRRLQAYMVMVYKTLHVVDGERSPHFPKDQLDVITAMSPTRGHQRHFRREFSH